MCAATCRFQGTKVPRPVPINKPGFSATREGSMAATSCSDPEADHRASKPGGGPGWMPEPLPALYSTEMDPPNLGNGRSGPNAFSANAPALPQASRNEPNASLLAT